MSKQYVDIYGNKLLTYIRMNDGQGGEVNLNPTKVENNQTWLLYQYDMLTGGCDWISEANGDWRAGNPAQTLGGLGGQNTSPTPLYTGASILSGGHDSNISNPSPYYIHVYSAGSGAHQDSFPTATTLGGVQFTDLQLKPSSIGPVLVSVIAGKAIVKVSENGLGQAYYTGPNTQRFGAFIDIVGGKLWYSTNNYFGGGGGGLVRTISNYTSNNWVDDGIDYKLSDAKINNKEPYGAIYDYRGQCWWAQYRFDDDPRLGLAKLSIDYQILDYDRTSHNIERMMPDGNGNLACIMSSIKYLVDGGPVKHDGPYGDGFGTNYRFSCIFDGSFGDFSYVPPFTIPVCALGNEVISIYPSNVQSSVSSIAVPNVF
ncbi:hypothetical protein Pla110_33100 [Polystyrenella longa]|uniref:Uncharacterized protein n=1 Tax=Polystyrenella longa TaxID=2528007 RepID=A0A518CQS1_9PLAN|nr:hypothetical protein [Polystyrenella longa]QDU81568.1 hypothetical protein Pla110_33100 [Polystyrenella longa]